MPSKTEGYKLNFAPSAYMDSHTHLDQVILGLLLEQLIAGDNGRLVRPSVNGIYKPRRCGENKLCVRARRGRRRVP